MRGYLIVVVNAVLILSVLTGVFLWTQFDSDITFKMGSVGETASAVADKEPPSLSKIFGQAYWR